MVRKHRTKNTTEKTNDEDDLLLSTSTATDTATGHQLCLFWRTAARLLPVTLHIIGILLYMYPIAHAPYIANVITKTKEPQAVLDEQAMLIPDEAVEPGQGVGSQDVYGPTPIHQIFYHDYWGTPMKKYGSHHSWRPLCILTFRLFHLVGKNTELSFMTVHRFVNVLIHTAVSEMVSIAGLLVLRPKSGSIKCILLRSAIKLVFLIHPTHVEAVANAANRPHILTIAMSLFCCDHRVPLALMAAVYPCGFLIGETFIFQMPAVIVTMILIRWLRSKSYDLRQLRHTVVSLLPRIFIALLCTFTYLFGRWYLGYLKPGQAANRREEVDFYYLKGLQLILSFSIVSAVHIGKSFFVDPLGFAEEYGYTCLRKVSGFTDYRLIFPSLIICTILLWGLYCLRKGLRATLTFIVFGAWMATLYPVCGFVTIGTFIADRMVVAASTGTSVLISKLLIDYICKVSNSFNKPKSSRTQKVVIVGYLGLAAHFFGKTFIRVGDWTSTFRLNQSGSITCPNGVKNLIGMSSVLLEDRYGLQDVPKARLLVERAEQISPEFCFTQYQLLRVAVVENDIPAYFKTFEKCMLCETARDKCIGQFIQMTTALMDGKKKLESFESNIIQTGNQIIRDTQEHLIKNSRG